MTLAQDAIPLARYAVALLLTTPLRFAQGDGLRLYQNVIGLILLYNWIEISPLHFVAVEMTLKSIRSIAGRRRK